MRKSDIVWNFTNHLEPFLLSNPGNIPQQVHIAAIILYTIPFPLDGDGPWITIPDSFLLISKPAFWNADRFYYFCYPEKLDSFIQQIWIIYSNIY